MLFDHCLRFVFVGGGCSVVLFEVCCFLLFCLLCGVQCVGLCVFLNVWRLLCFVVN